MKSRLIYILLLHGLLLTSCGQENKKEKAGIYYDSYLAAIKPYKTGTEKIMSDTKWMIERKIKSTGSIKLTEQDSLKLVKLFNDFKLLAEDTRSKLNGLDNFEEFNLKTPALQYVDRSSKVILGSYKEIIFPFQDNVTEVDEEKLELLVGTFTTEFLEANRSFGIVQKEFLDKFGFPAN